MQNHSIMALPIHEQLKNALSFIKTNIIGEKVVKQRGREKALRFFNFPYEAVEEALTNCVYHKGYDRRDPIEVQIFPDKIVMLNFPGPVPPIDEKILKNKRQFWARSSRNRRIGDFLKELELTEGRSTGVPLIYREMEKNGSPKPVFETDDDRTYFLTILPAHERYNESDEQTSKPTEQVSKKEPVQKLSERQQKIVKYVQKNGSISNKILQELTGISRNTASLDLQMLIDNGVLQKIGVKKGVIYTLTK